MPNMSFMLTIEQMRTKRKRVTRRLGWLKLKPGDVVQPVERCMGITKGGHVSPIGGPIRVTSVRREPLKAMLESPDYGAIECSLEGFEQMPPTDFVRLFCDTHKGCTMDTNVTRIEFEFLPGQVALPFGDA